MSDYRTDTFKVGDLVEWTAAYADPKRHRAVFGEGPFKITKVIDRYYEPPESEFDQSNWSAMGHTQHVFIDAAQGNMFSGAYFQLAAREADPS